MMPCESMSLSRSRTTFGFHRVLSEEEKMSIIDQARLDLMHRYWNAENYLTIGQIYLQENPLLREPLQAKHIKPRFLGHWGTS